MEEKWEIRNWDKFSNLKVWLNFTQKLNINASQPWSISTTKVKNLVDFDNLKRSPKCSSTECEAMNLGFLVNTKKEVVDDFDGLS